MKRDRREDPGQYFPGGKVIPKTPIPAGGGTPVEFDDEPTQGSQKAARSGGIWSWVTGLLGSLTLPWSKVTDKPTAFPPEAHSHQQSQVEGLVDALASKLDKSSKISDLHDEDGTPTADNRLELLGTGKLQSKTKVQTGWGTIRLDHLSDAFVAYDYNGDPYLSTPPLGEWKGPFGPFSMSTVYYVPESEPDPTSDAEATAGKWCLFKNSTQWNLMYSQSAYAPIPSIEAAEFTNDSASDPAPYAIVGHAYFTREPVTETQTRKFAETTDIIKQSQVTEQTPDGKAADAKDLKAQLAGKRGKYDLSVYDAWDYTPWSSVIPGEYKLYKKTGLDPRWYVDHRDGVASEWSEIGYGNAPGGDPMKFSMHTTISGFDTIRYVEISRTGKSQDDSIARLSDIPALAAPSSTATDAQAAKAKSTWSLVWGALTALPTGFTSLYDWCVSQLAGKLDLSGGEMTMQIAGGLKLKFFGGTEGEKDGIMFVDENDQAAAGLGVALGRLCVFGVGFYLDGTTGLEIGDTVYSKGSIQRQGSNIVIPLKSGTLALLSDILARIAPTYSATSAYAIGAKVVYNGALYTCKTAIPTGGETWNAAHWDALANLSGVLSGLKSDGNATDQFATDLLGKSVAKTAIRNLGLKFDETEGYWCLETEEA